MKDTTRRNFLTSSLGIAATAVAGKAIAQSCGILTPAQTEGPFYPVNPQADTNWDLTQVDGRIYPARGERVYVGGKVTDQHCNPVEGVLVDIWQACDTGKYNHPNDPNTAELDPNFQYWGMAVTNIEGDYLFKTIIPGAYPATSTWMRPPHIHYKVTKRGYRELTTQLYFDDKRFDKLNQEDLILQELSKAEQSRVLVPIQKTADGLGQKMVFDISIEKL